MFAISSQIETDSGKFNSCVLHAASKLSIAPTHLKPAFSKPRDIPPAPENKSIKLIVFP